MAIVLYNTAGPTGLPFLTYIHSSGRYLLDQYANPYLLLSDQILPCVSNAAVSDIETVIIDRANRGYNAMWISLINDTYIGATDPPVDFLGNTPFTGSGLTGPRAAYWTRVDQIVTIAASYGMTCILTPIESAGNAFALARTAGTAGCFAYGQFLGSRYVASPNIVWIHGNDFGNTGSWISGEPPNYSNPPNSNPGYQAGDAALANEMFLGIRAAGAIHPLGAELNFDISLTSDDSTTVPWRTITQVNHAYSYYKTYDVVYKGWLRINSNDSLAHAARFPPKPVHLGEANYEGGDNLGGGANPAAPRVIRAQEYWTVLAGGLGGQVWGNKALHHFATGWQSNLNTTGAQDATRWASFFRSYKWYNLIPDINHNFVTSGYGTYDGSATSITPTPGTYATAAQTADGTLGLCYTPVNQGLVVALSTFAGNGTARWYDPTSGSYSTAGSGSFTNSGTATYTPSATNSAGDTDWVLVLTVP